MYIYTLTYTCQDEDKPSLGHYTMSSYTLDEALESLIDNFTAYSGLFIFKGNKDPGFVVTFPDLAKFLFETDTPDRNEYLLSDVNKLSNTIRIKIIDEIQTKI